MQAVGFVLYQIQSRKTSIYIYKKSQLCIPTRRYLFIKENEKREQKDQNFN